MEDLLKKHDLLLFHVHLKLNKITVNIFTTMSIKVYKMLTK